MRAIKQVAWCAMAILFSFGLAACSPSPDVVQESEDEPAEPQATASIVFENEQFGIHFELPPEYKYGTAKAANDGEQQVFFSSDADNNHVEVFLRDLSYDPVFDDDVTWSHAYLQSLRLLLSSRDEAIETAEGRRLSIDGKSCSGVYAKSNSADKESHREYLFLSQGKKGLCVGLTTHSEEALKKLEQALNIKAADK